jgi:beta-lysine 5,6-aminomutase beta subunit
MLKGDIEMSTYIKPYGDTLNDGIIQLSFTLPVENGAKARRAAEMYAVHLNLENVSVSHSKKIADGFTYFVVYGKAKPSLDFDAITVSEVDIPSMDFYGINKMIESELQRKMVVVGATIGSDAHTVGIDAIMNMKGYNQDYGLERYPEIEALNMGAQVGCEDLLEKALDMKADAILISQTVTQKESHLHNFTEFIELLEAEDLRDRYVLIAGGPRITNDLAIELGYDAGFGPGTLPSQVASYLINQLLNKKGVN